MGRKPGRAPWCNRPRRGFAKIVLVLLPAVSKEMFYTPRDPKELTPHNDSWRLIGLQLRSSIEMKSQQPPLLTLSKYPGPALEEATTPLRPVSYFSCAGGESGERCFSPWMQTASHKK